MKMAIDRQHGVIPRYMRAADATARSDGTRTESEVGAASEMEEIQVALLMHKRAQPQVVPLISENGVKNIKMNAHHIRFQII